MQLGRPMLIIEIVIILVSAVFLYITNIDRYIKDRFDSGRKIAQNTADVLEEYKSLGFLVPYWHDNYEKMDFFYTDDEKLAQKQKALFEKYPEITDIKFITEEQAKSFDDEGQLLLAEICYSRLSHDFDRTKSAYRPMYLYSFIIDGNNMFNLVTGTKDNEKRQSEGGDLFELGVTNDYEEGRYPILDETIRTGEPSAKMELSMKKGADKSVMHLFEPVYSNDRLVMYVGVSIQWRDLISSVLGMSLLVAFVMSVLFILLVQLFFILIKKKLIIPLKTEQDIINEYKQNKNAEETVTALSFITSNNEIQEIAEDFSAMVLELERHIEDVKSITKEKERIGAELDMATQIQAGQLPSVFPAFPERTEFDIHATMTPAKEVGGDFYDFFFVDNDHLAMVIADVSGKGVPAALFMMMSKILINNYAMMGLSPHEVLEKTNETICENNKQGMFVTVWLGILEVSTGKITAANAGHEYPIIRQPDGQFELFRDKHGFVIGGIKNKKYKQYEFTLQKGGTLFVYTDGVPEATNEQQELYGTQRLVEVMNKTPDARPKELLDNVHKAVNKFVGDAPQFDDLTMLAITLL